MFADFLDKFSILSIALSTVFNNILYNNSNAFSVVNIC